MSPIRSQGTIDPVNEVQHSLFKTRLVLITLFLVFFCLALGLHRLFK
jgi:hypothetical protein